MVLNPFQRCLCFSIPFNPHCAEWWEHRRVVGQGYGEALISEEPFYFGENRKQIFSPLAACHLSEVRATYRFCSRRHVVFFGCQLLLVAV